VPDPEQRRWKVFADTAATPPKDIAEAGLEAPLEGDRYTAQPRSVVVLVSGRP
jgi:hypothetical protein